MPRVATPLGTWAYEEAGVAPAPGAPVVVLLHGLLMDRHMWSGQLERLAALTRVVAFDGPGHGESAPPPSFSLDAHADALAFALEALRASPALVVGHSWGGMVALRLALRHRARVTGLALVDTSARPEPVLRRLQYLGFIALYRVAGMPRWLARTRIGPLLFGRKLAAREPWLVDDLVHRLNAADRAGVARAARAVLLGRGDVTDLLGLVTVPTLVVCGTEDRSTPAAYTAELGAAIPRARVEWIEGAGHTTPIEEPGRVAGHLAQFVAAQLERPRGLSGG
jgi:pimeloyl-ACP methyl ester carboxylesterase